jgi:endonuclease YncB( thermonuclease family)
LRIGQQLIRLQGIDAPEFEQHCQDEQGRAWPCGRGAQAGLAQLIGHSLISCTINGSDRYGRALATCSNDRVGDVGQAMVRAGLAVNFLGWRYQLAQLQARAQTVSGAALSRHHKTGAAGAEPRTAKALQDFAAGQPPT